MEAQTNNHQTPIRILLTVKQMAEKYPVFTELALRNLIFKAKPIVMSRGTKPGNGLDEAITHRWRVPGSISPRSPILRHFAKSPASRGVSTGIGYSCTGIRCLMRAFPSCLPSRSEWTKAASSSPVMSMDNSRKQALIPNALSNAMDLSTTYSVWKSVHMRFGQQMMLYP